MHYRQLIFALLCILYGSIPAAAQQRSLSDRYFRPDARMDAVVDSIYRSLSDQERAAQMIMTASSTSPKLGYPYETAKNMLNKNVAANVVFLKGTAAAFRQQVQELNQLSDSRKKPRPLFACDCEPSLLPSKWTDAPAVVPASAQQDTATVIANTKKINRIMHQTGVQLNFAPVADIALNTAVINKRSFGNNPEKIAQLSSSFIRATQEENIGATVKHFPGHGAVKGDSHKQSVYIDGELTELNTFKHILQSGTPPVSVMIGHIVVRNNKRYATGDLPASLSPVIIKNLLRKELGYQGIITTDALNMAAAAKIPDADWKAVLAGVDLILMPRDAAALNRRLAAALASGDATAKQIESSVKRIIRLKVALGII